ATAVATNAFTATRPPPATPPAATLRQIACENAPARLPSAFIFQKPAVVRTARHLAAMGK
ncbi:hypothetical protein CF326_g3848, partial [Tilletia indica]